MRKVVGVPRSLDPMSVIHGFWDASLHKVAPPLRTTFGNFATVNLVERFVVKTSVLADTIIWIPWTPSPLAAMVFALTDAASNSIPKQQLFKPLAPSTAPGTGVPKAVRPLRSSFRVTSLTKNINTSNALHVLSYDNALNIQAVFGATQGTSAQLTGSTTVSLKEMITDSPETKVYPLTKFVDPHTFVSVPSSWPDYNKYHNFCTFRNSNTDGTDLLSGDLYTLTAREDSFVSAGTQNDSVTYPYTASTTTNLVAGFGDVPAMRGHLILLPPLQDEQILEFEIFRQLGCRFVSNTIGHSFHHTPAGGDTKSETNLLSSIQQISNNASAAFKSAALDVGTGYAAISGVAKAISQDASSAMNFLSGALRSVKAV